MQELFNNIYTATDHKLDASTRRQLRADVDVLQDSSHGRASVATRISVTEGKPMTVSPCT